MSILDRLFKRSDEKRGETGDDEQRAFLYYLRCDKCGEAIRVRIDREHGLSQEFDEGGGDFPTGYVATKEIIGKKCLRALKLTIRFDRSRREVDRQVQGGAFITREEFEQGAQSPPQQA